MILNHLNIFLNEILNLVFGGGVFIFFKILIILNHLNTLLNGILHSVFKAVYSYFQLHKIK